MSTAYDPYPLSALPTPLPEEAPLVCVGRLAHGKGMHLLLEALAIEALGRHAGDMFGVGVDGDDFAYRLERCAKKRHFPFGSWTSVSMSGKYCHAIASSCPHRDTSLWDAS